MQALAMIERIQELLAKKSLHEYEIFVASTDKLRAEAKEGVVHSLDRASETGLSLRILLDGAFGFAYGSRADEELVEAALLSARHQFKDEFNHIPQVSVDPMELDVYDERIVRAGPDECIERAIELEAASRAADQRIQQVRKASFSRAITHVHLVNSKEVAVSARATTCGASIMVMARQGDDMQAGYEFGFSHAWPDIDVHWIGSEAARQATSMLGARHIKTMRLPVLFDNTATSDMLGIIGQSFLGENVIKGKSYLKDKLGAACFSPVINLSDNPLDPLAADACGFDGEGMPSRDNVLIKDGVLQGYVYDSYWAKVAGTASTGNAVRGGYRSIPGLGLRHLCLMPAHNGGAGLKGPGQTLKVTDIMGLHMADPISGEFSVGVNGFLMQDDEVLYPVREAALSGNIFEMFARVLAVGSDVRAFGSVKCPSVLIDAMDLSSK
ncbi:MAG: TldD/PmbA family protein [Syntrophaceae bacterium]